jgi:hypothetical protein
LREELLMQIRSQAVRLAQLTGLVPQRTEFERILEPLLEQAREISKLKDPRGLYSYCWCRAPRER